jgi:pyruvate,orthophosphate dikinase
MAGVKLFYGVDEITSDDLQFVGSKALNLVTTKKLGYNVPSFFVLSSEFCSNFSCELKVMPQKAVEIILNQVSILEKHTNKVFGSDTNPLLLSVRSSSIDFMPGMLDSVLNIGVNDKIAENMSETMENKTFAYDTYRRFIEMYMNVVAKIDKKEIEEISIELKQKKNKTRDSQFSVSDLKYLIRKYKDMFKKETGDDFPQDVKVQIVKCLAAVLQSWHSKLSIMYKRSYNILNQTGMGVIVQEMVHGNFNENSLSGVVYSRNPISGENEIYGEYLNQVQCEDVVAGFKTPFEIQKLNLENPKLYKRLCDVVKVLENHFKDMQYVEFTVENGKPYVLQTLNAKRTALAALKIAVDLVQKEKIEKKDAIMMINAKQLNSILHPQFEAKALHNQEVLAVGLAVSPGAVSGKIALSKETIMEYRAKKEAAILVKEEASPEDLFDLSRLNALLTKSGGTTSHTAVITRDIGKSYVAGCSSIEIDLFEKTVKIGEQVFNEGDVISMDGITGKIYAGEFRTHSITLPSEYYTLMSWADEFRLMQIKANVKNAEEAQIAYNFGAEGIGLVRTEFMFFEEGRLKSLLEMILATDNIQRTRALAKIMPCQKDDFIAIFRQMKGYPVTVRLLDPPLHEALPKDDEEIEKLARELVVSFNTLNKTIKSLKEFNPMMGHRGLRLNITYPEIAQMQTQAMIEAAIEVNKQFGYNMVVEILIPLSADAKEYEYVHKIVKAQADKTIKDEGAELKYKIGTMIELPRACLVADELAQKAEFFTFGTNDLTQMTYGFSRDDSDKFLPNYYLKRILEFDPFLTIDEKGVGKLINMAISSARKIDPNFKVGVCGEHGGDPLSVNFFHSWGFNYVSCSAYKVPIARLSAAQANIKNPRKLKVF